MTAKVSPASPSLLATAWGWVLLAGLLAFVPGMERPGEAPREAFLLIAAPALLVLALGAKGWRPSARLGCGLGTVLLLAVVSLLKAPGVERGCSSRDLAVMAAPWLLAWVASGTAPGLEEKLGKFAGGALWILAPLGLAQAWLGWEGVPQARPPAATFANRNVAAETLVILVPLALTALGSARTPRGRFFWALGGGLGAAFLVATRSRGGWAAALAGWGTGLAVLAWIHRKKWVPRWREGALPGLALLIPVLTALVIPVRGPEPLPGVAATLTTASREGAEGSLAIRGALRRNTAALIADHPLLGVGPGRFAAVFPLYHKRVAPTPGFGLARQPEHVENDFLETAAELGIPGALLLFSLAGAALLRALRRTAEELPATTTAVAAASVAGIAGILVHGLVAFPLQSPSSALLFWTLAGLAFRDRPGRQTKALPPAGNLGRRAGLVIGSGLLLAGVFVARGEFRAQLRLGAAVQAQFAGSPASASALAREAARAAPWQRRDRALAAMVVYDSEQAPQASLAVLEPALELHPNHLNLLLATGARRLKAGRPGEAEQAFRRALSIKEDFGRPWLGLAMALDGQNRRADAAEACRRAVSFRDLPEAETYCR